MNLVYKVEQNITINNILSKKLNISTRLKTKLIKSKNILLNGSFIDTRNLAHIGDTLTVNLNYDEDNTNIIPTQMNLDIIYEDSHFLAINKPAGIAVHPSILHYNDSLANGIKYYFDIIGLVLFAKNEYVQECLIKQMNTSNYIKIYLAVVHGKLTNNKGTINAPIARKENSIIERCVSEKGQTAITHYEVLKKFNEFSLVQCILETGRTHQIRVHLAHLGNPLLGDSLYGADNQNLIKRQALHSYKMEFFHPILKEKLCLEAPLPEDIQKIINQ